MSVWGTTKKTRNYILYIHIKKQIEYGAERRKKVQEQI